MMMIADKDAKEGERLTVESAFGNGNDKMNIMAYKISSRISHGQVHRSFTSKR